jgi:hypothetical protein
MHGAEGAVALAGSALHGRKRSDPARVAEIAHFAARALNGSHYFDAVSRAVTSTRGHQFCVVILKLLWTPLSLRIA